MKTHFWQTMTIFLVTALSLHSYSVLAQEEAPLAQDSLEVTADNSDEAEEEEEEWGGKTYQFERGQFVVEEIKETDFSGIFLYITEDKDLEIVHDCQTLSPGISIRPISDLSDGAPGPLHIFMDEADCHEIYQKAKALIEESGRFCLDLDATQDQIQVFALGEGQGQGCQ